MPDRAAAKILTAWTERLEPLYKEASLAGWLDQAHAFASTLPPKASAAKPATGSAAKKQPATAKPAAKLPAGKRAAAPKRAAKSKPRR